MEERNALPGMGPGLGDRAETPAASPGRAAAWVRLVPGQQVGPEGASFCLGPARPPRLWLV